jgi:ATP-binding cassette, subfamily C, type I secretion system permease/ATPase
MASEPVGVPADVEGGRALAAAREALRRPVLAVALFSLVINVLALTVPIYMTQVYDRVLTSFSIETLVLLTLLALGLLALLVALDNIRAQVLTRAALEAEQTLGPALYAAAAQDHLAGRVDASLPLRDLVSLRGFATSPVLTACFDAPVTPLYVLVTFLIHPLLGSVALLGALVMLGATIANQAATANRVDRAGKASNVLLHNADQQTRNADVISAMGLLPALRRRWRLAQDGALAEQLAANDTGGLYQMALRFVRLSLQVATLAVGAWLVIAGDITAGAMFASSIILSRGLQPLEIAVGSWRAMLAARASYARIRDALARAVVRGDVLRLPDPKGRVSVENVYFLAGPERRPILKGVSLELAPGESLGIIGPAASGKSTLARLILGVLTPSSGKVRIDSADVAQRSRADFGPHVGYLPQEVELFPGTVADNIARMETPDAQQVVVAAQWAGVHEMVLRFPQGYDTPIMAGGLMLSPGQRQRIALARALYRGPKLLVLDEPNSNLDGEGELALGVALKQAKERGITLIVIAHRAGILREADKVLVLRDGTAQDYGARDEVLARVAQAAQVPKVSVIRGNPGAA